jgi:hypothetical protein
VQTIGVSIDWDSVPSSIPDFDNKPLYDTVIDIMKM